MREYVRSSVGVSSCIRSRFVPVDCFFLCPRGFSDNSDEVHNYQPVSAGSSPAFPLRQPRIAFNARS